MAGFDKGIISVRLPHPSGQGHLDLRMATKDVDALFVSVDAVAKILAPHYDRTLGRGEGEKLLNEVKQQGLDPWCVVIHKYSCGRIVPPIRLDAKSPIEVG
jgi:hypothetical protein